MDTDDVVDQDSKPTTVNRDPNDLSEYNLDQYDEETAGVGKRSSLNYKIDSSRLTAAQLTVHSAISKG